MGFIKNVLTFGAAARVESKLEEFQDAKEEYERLYATMEQRRVEVNEKLEEVIRVKVECVQALKQITKISKNLKSKDREVLYRKLGNELELVSFEGVEKTISAADMAMNMTKGVSAGVGTALGAWALVSTFGTASTGTAIAGLSGAAATNATLAWFGGGALAAGGGGMAAGTAVLGGIVAIPALVLTGVLSHLKANKQIKEIEAKIEEVFRATAQVRANIFKLNAIEKRSDELLISLRKSKEVFEHEFNKVYKAIYPSFFSKPWKIFRKMILRQKSFSEEELRNIAYIGGLAMDFAKLIDTKVFGDESEESNQ